ncbi:hypothetical protein BaRGS_00030364 [Batillaria attramentaria]|uniref:Enhancer of mRNA-decapping protein 4 WD40 repeat region domain-containing protein n=1 Tax=Batillaria attramentaria TaxID=370345 RepID=A0ABD0JUK6_9CAEN
MNNEDASSTSLNSTDTSQFLRELQALNQSASSTSYTPTTNSGDIVFSGSSSDIENSFSVYGREVDIYIAPSLDGPRAGSNKVKITPVVNHAWEQRYYYGNLVAVHRDGDFVAFVLKGKSGGNVRIISRRTAERALLKGFTGSVLDVAFAHSEEVILAAVDETGSLFVYTCQLGQDGKIVHWFITLTFGSTTPMLIVNRAASGGVSEYHRVIWCPYWPDEDGDDDADGFGQDSSKMLAITQEESIELWAVDMVTRDYGAGPLNPDDVESGRIVVIGHKEVDWSDTGTSMSPRCLHQWQPHDGQPLSYLAFLDDLTNMSPDAQFWKYAITGASKNQELKLWSCETWSCLQSIRFLTPPDSLRCPSPTLKACIDASSHFIILSDKLHMVVYVMQIHQDNVAGTAHVSSVSEFPLTQPCLSFAILEASTKTFKSRHDDSHLDEITTGEVEPERDVSQNHQDEDSSPTTSGVQIRLYGVHTKALQELLIRYRPESSASAMGSAGSASHDGLSLRDGLSDVSVGPETSFTEGEATGEDLTRPAAKSQSAPLMTPDAFTASVSKGSSPAGPSAHTSNITATTDDVLSSTSSFTHVTGLTGQNAEDLLLSPASSIDPSAAAVSASDPTVLAPISPNTPNVGNGYVSDDRTPTNIPLPPEEEDELVTPKSSQRDSNTPKSSQRSNADSLTPRSHHSGGAEPAQVGDLLEAFFSSQASPAATHQGQGEAAPSTGSFEVESGATKGAGDGRVKRASAGDGPDIYDENDQEVAEVLGEDLDKSFASSAASGAGATPVDTQEFPPDHITEDERPHKPWPRPPDVSTEAKRLVSEVLEQSAEEEGPDKEPAAEDEYSEDQNEEDEAEIEEEIEEVVEEEEDEEDDTGRDSEQREYVAGARGRGSRDPPIQIIKEIVDRGMLSELQECIGKLSAEVGRQQQQLAQLQQQLVDQHEVQVELQRQQLDQVTLRSAVQPMPDLEQQLGRVQNVVASLMQKAIEQLKEQVHTEVAQKLTATDALLKDNIGKMVRSRQTTEAIATAASNALQGPMQSHLRDAFQSHVVPAFEHATQTMANQVNTAFQTGTRDYTSQLKSHLEQVRQAQASARDPIVGQLKGLVESFQRETQQMQEQVVQTLRAEVSGHLKSSLQGFQEQLNAGVRTVVRAEISAAMREHDTTMTDRLATYLRSGAATPVPMSGTPDPSTVQALQAQIKQLVNANRLNEAFQTALTASNLELVVFVCELVNPSQVFGDAPCPLSQPVLLSLIQQLSAELQSSFQTKIKFLTEAVMSLDPNEVVTREHIPTVLEALVAKLRRYQSTHPHSKDVKLLLMAAMSLMSR